MSGDNVERLLSILERKLQEREPIRNVIDFWETKVRNSIQTEAHLRTTAKRIAELLQRFEAERNITAKKYAGILKLMARDLVARAGEVETKVKDTTIHDGLFSPPSLVSEEHVQRAKKILEVVSRKYPEFKRIIDDLEKEKMRAEELHRQGNIITVRNEFFKRYGFSPEELETTTAVLARRSPLWHIHENKKYFP